MDQVRRLLMGGGLAVLVACTPVEAQVAGPPDAGASSEQGAGPAQTVAGGDAGAVDAGAAATDAGVSAADAGVSAADASVTAPNLQGGVPSPGQSGGIRIPYCAPWPSCTSETAPTCAPWPSCAGGGAAAAPALTDAGRVAPSDGGSDGGGVVEGSDAGVVR